MASDVSGVETQGRGEIDEWVSQFMVSYSLDAFKWEFARDIYGNKKVFRGNSDAHSVRHSYLEHPVCDTYKYSYILICTSNALQNYFPTSG